MSSQNSGQFSLPYTVIRVLAGDSRNPELVHTGTGFFYVLDVSGTDVPVIISNKHVLADKAWLEFDFASRNDESARIFGPPTKLRANFGDFPIFIHPDPSVDLAAVPLIPLLDRLNALGAKPHTLVLSKGNFPPIHIEKALFASKSVLMIGFPNGIMDMANNLPVVRRGSLATHYAADYQGASNFVIDIAAFGGSSGSPIFSFSEQLLPDEQGNISLYSEPQIHLIGVLHSGPTMTAKGDIVITPTPTAHANSLTNVMLHLGYCVKAWRIDELASPVSEYLRSQVGALRTPIWPR